MLDSTFIYSGNTHRTYAIWHHLRVFHSKLPQMVENENENGNGNTNENGNFIKKPKTDKCKLFVVESQLYNGV